MMVIVVVVVMELSVTKCDDNGGGSGSGLAVMCFEPSQPQRLTLGLDGACTCVQRGYMCIPMRRCVCKHEKHTCV